MTEEVMYGTCETIVSAEIINVCDIVICRLDTLMELTDTNGKEKKLKTLRGKIEEVCEYAKGLK